LDEWWSYLPAGTIDDQVGDLGLSYVESGWLLALLTLGGLIGTPIAALADRGLRRSLAVPGAVTIAVGLATFALGPSFPWLAVAATLLGAASDTLIRPLESSLAELADDRLDRMLGRQHLITWLGDLIAPALLAVAAATVVGWRGVFAGTAAAFVVFALVLALVPFPVASAPVGADDPDFVPVRSLVRLPELWLLIGAEFILLPLDETFLGFAVARVAATGDPSIAQLLAGATVVGGIAGALTVTRAGLNPRRVALGCAFLVAGAFLTSAPLPIGGQLCGLTLVGLGTAIVWAKLHHRTLTLVPGRSATVPSLVGILSTPALLIPVAMGGIADAVSLTAALASAAALSLPLAAVVMRLKRATVTAKEVSALD
jgi:MFS family permease